MPNKAGVAAALCSLVFIGVLAISAYWDRSIRILHVFESLPYLLTAVLCLRRKKSGYALGIVSGAFWLGMAGLRTTFVRNGFEQLDILVRTGAIDRPDVLIAVPAAVSTAGLSLLSAVGYARRPDRSWQDVKPFAAAIVGVPVFFVALFAVWAPQYLALFKAW